MHHVLDGDADVAKRLGQLGDAARPVAHSDGELDQAAVGGQASLQAAAQNGRVDVAAAKQDDHAAKGIILRNFRNRTSVYFRNFTISQCFDSNPQFSWLAFIFHP